MIVFRLCKSKYSSDLSGNGAATVGGRWNSVGTKIIYTSESRALCMAEIAVHMPFGIIPVNYTMVSIEIPESYQKTFDIKDLPINWKTFPHSNATQIVGDKFVIENKYLSFRVPSVIVPGEFNILLNPVHSENKKVKILKIEPFEFDSRLFIK